MDRLDLVVNEVYLSLQGESTWAGLPCVFIRLTGCPLRCSYCDTAYAFSEGRRQSLEEVLMRVGELATDYGGVSGHIRLPLVELTGGEPLIQAGVHPLMRRLCDNGFTVLLETSGAIDIGSVDGRVHRIVDLKCPSSGECGRNLWENLESLRATDEVKFVVATASDYVWMQQVIAERRLAGRCPLLVSWAAPLEGPQRHPSLRPGPSEEERITRAELAERVLRDRLPVRFQVQLHKQIWPSEMRGV